MTRFDLSMTAGPIVVSGIIQGAGIGLIFVPLSTLAFTTLPPTLRAEATGVYTLMRSLGASVGISLMEALWTSNTSVAHSTLAAHVIPSDVAVKAALGTSLGAGGAGGSGGLEALNGEITRQAAMVAYLDDFKLMMFITLACMPLLLLMRTPKLAPEEGVHVVVD
jgi:DHA2 family multidrug resistance protein